MTVTTYTEETVQVGPTALHLLKGGSGRPLLFLHGIEGPEGWLDVHDRLADRAMVYAPAQPGYGETERPDWIESNAHVALFYLWFLQEAGLDAVDLVGAGVGGWIAAEMAVMCPQVLRHLVLVDAAGVRPHEAEILDVFVIPWREVIERSFYDPAASLEYQRIYGATPIQDYGGSRESGRSMALRTCYRPYMHDPALLPLLSRVRVPTLVTWGAQDQVVPLECGRMLAQAIPGARLEVINQCGHWPHYERPEALAALISEFVSG
jgi:pimeloyl-ACP methyl ester carboxylesterase